MKINKKDILLQNECIIRGIGNEEEEKKWVRYTTLILWLHPSQPLMYTNLNAVLLKQHFFTKFCHFFFISHLYAA